MKFIELSYNSEQYKVFVDRFNKGQVFWNPQIIRFNADCKNTQAFVFGIVSDNNELLAVLNGVILKNYIWPFSFFTSRALVYGNPILKENDPVLLYKLIDGITKYLKNKCIYIQFRNDDRRIDWDTIFAKSGYRFYDHLNILIHLKGAWEPIHTAISKNKRRNIIKSENKGVTFYELKDLQQFMEAIELLYSTYKRIALPIPERNYFKNAFQKLQPKGAMKCFVAELEGAYIGVRLELIYNHIIFDWYAGSKEGESNKYPNDYLIYHILKWSNDHNFQVFDFGGAGSPNRAYGVREHKLKFGGQLISPGRYIRINHRIFYALGEKVIMLVKKMSK